MVFDGWPRVRVGREERVCRAAEGGEHGRAMSVYLWLRVLRNKNSRYIKRHGSIHNPITLLVLYSYDDIESSEATVLYCIFCLIDFFDFFIDEKESMKS